MNIHRYLTEVSVRYVVHVFYVGVCILHQRNLPFLNLVDANVLIVYDIAKKLERKYMINLKENINKWVFICVD